MSKTAAWNHLISDSRLGRKNAPIDSMRLHSEGRFAGRMSGLAPPQCQPSKNELVPCRMVEGFLC